jgi:DNA-binding NarL/FixJ family response regulator
MGPLAFAPLTPELVEANREALELALTTPTDFPSPFDERVMALLAEGLTNWQISRVVRSTDRAIAVRVERLLAHVEAANRAQLVATAIREGWIAWTGRTWASGSHPSGGAG